MNRRHFVQLLGLGAVALRFPFRAVPVHARTLPTIDQLLHASFPGVLTTMRGGRPWVNPDLNQSTREQRILFKTLGAVVRVSTDPGPHKTYPVSELAIPIVWTQRDEDRAITKEQRIDLVSQLLENAIYSHDDSLAARLGAGRAVVSQEYHYNLGVTQGIPLDNSPYAYVCKLYTAVGFID